MNKISKIIVGMLTAIAIFCFFGSSTRADDVTIAFENDSSGTKCIDVNKLAKQMKVEAKTGDKFEITINNKKLSFNENNGYVLVDGEVVTLKTKSVLDVNSKEKYNLPIISKIEKNDEGGYLIPVEFLTKYFDLKTNDSGVIVPLTPIKTPEKKEEVKPNTKETTDNSNTVTNTGNRRRHNNTYYNDTNDTSSESTGGDSSVSSSESQATPAPDNGGGSNSSTPQAPQGGESSGGSETDNPGSTGEVPQE